MKTKINPFLLIDDDSTMPLKHRRGSRIFVTKDGYLEVCWKIGAKWTSAYSYEPHEWKYNPKYITKLLDDGKKLAMKLRRRK